MISINFVRILILLRRNLLTGMVLLLFVHVCRLKESSARSSFTLSLVSFSEQLTQTRSFFEGETQTKFYRNVRADILDHVFPTTDDPGVSFVLSSFVQIVVLDSYTQKIFYSNKKKTTILLKKCIHTHSQKWNHNKASCNMSTDCVQIWIYRDITTTTTKHAASSAAKLQQQNQNIHRERWMHLQLSDLLFFTDFVCFFSQFVRLWERWWSSSRVWIMYLWKYTEESCQTGRLYVHRCVYSSFLFIVDLYLNYWMYIFII